MNKKPIFIHSLFRTGSTYIWNKFRQDDKYYCYYEPLHQVLSEITTENIEYMMSRDFQAVHHPQLDKYYLHEYKPLLKKGITGIPYFKKAFSFDEFCLTDKNPELKKYIDYLIAGAEDKTPVFQFNRSAFRVRWFKENYPGSLNIYMLRHPRDQWKSYFELYQRTQFQDFFVMDLLIASANKDKDDFKHLSEIIPLITYHSRRQTREDDFYRVILDSYSKEEKYEIFYWTWFRALNENVLHADFVLNINLLSKNPVYRDKVIEFLCGKGIEDISLDDAQVKEYSNYPLPVNDMIRIEENLRAITTQSLTGDKLNHFFQRISKEDRKFFQFDKRNLQKQNKQDSMTTVNIGEKTIEKLKKMVEMFAAEYFTIIGKNKHDNRTLKTKDAIIAQTALELRKKNLLLAKKNKQLKQKDIQLTEIKQQKELVEFNYLKIRSSFVYRVGKIVTFPLRAARKILFGSLKFIPGFFRQNYKNVVFYFKGYEKKVNLSEDMDADFGRHRSGWSYVVQILKDFHNPKGIVLDTFVERTFFWHPQGPRPHLSPWIGFIHVPPNIPEWFHYEQANEKLFRTNAWKKSFRHCKGLFTLSNYHRKHLETRLDIPVNNLIFSTETPKIKWSWRKFSANKEIKIVQVGWWLRKLHAIYQLPRTDYSKLLLSVEHKSIPRLMEEEKRILEKEGTFNESMYDTVETITFLPDKAYDKLLSENIVFVYLYDASANNTVIECIVRNTPLLINPIDPVKEYLGEDYPFYYNSYEEAAHKVSDLDLIYKTHQFLLDHPIKEKIKRKYFRQSFVNSQIYRSLQV